MSSRDLHAVKITIPHVPSRDQAAREVRVGPYGFRFQADGAALAFATMANNTAGAVGITCEVVPYDGAIEHRPGTFTLDVIDLAAQIQAEKIATGAEFPDVYSRLYAHLGFDQASQQWQAACDLLDDESNAADEEAERERAEQAERFRTDQTRRLVDAVPRRSLLTEPVRAQAASLLDALYRVSAEHGVDPETWRDYASLPAACVEVVAAVTRRGGPDRAAAAAGRDGESLAADLIEAVRATLTERGLRDRTSRRGKIGIAISVVGGHQIVLVCTKEGWDLTPGSIDDLSVPARRIDAPFDLDGARAVGELLANIADGRAPYPFGGRA